MNDPLLTSQRSSSSSSSSNARMLVAISLTLIAFLVEICNNNPRIVNLPNIISNSLAPLPNINSFSALLVLTTLSILLLYIHHLQTRVSKSSIPGLPTTPNAHFFSGHYSFLVRPSTHPALFRNHATPSGITSFWGPGLKPCASVLRADHVRLILRHTPNRDFSNFIVRHGRKTLGKDSLILIGGGKEWKRTRKVVQGAFTVGAIEAGRGAVGACAVEMVRWLMCMVDGDRHDGGCCGHGCVMVNDDGDGEMGKKKKRHCVHIDVENFFKLFSLEVFGKVTFDYDFECLKKATSSSNSNSSSSSSDKNNTVTTCTCFTSPPEAAAFEYLERDIGVRSHPRNLFNPLTEFYWMPTRHNREYRQNLKLVNTLMEEVIGLKLDDFLKKRELEEDNMITMLLKSVIEQYYHQPGEKKKAQTGRHSMSSSTSCPFSSSTSVHQTNNSIPNIPTNTMTKSDRTQIINNVIQVLHTLLVAGYETTAVSLSYTMYCLSKHPRCQDRACEEARRVLGSATTLDDAKFDEDALPYCKAIIMESLRIHVPVVFTTRSCAKDLRLDTDDEGGMATIPKGTRFIISPTIVHLDERNFERAEEFLPERWVRWEDGRWVDRDFEKEKSAGSAAAATNNTSPPSLSEKYANENARADTISAANPQSFFAFSDGARNCIGRRLAIMESTIFVAVLFRDMCVDLAVEGYELVKERRFVILAPRSLPIAFWKRDEMIE